MIKSITEQFFLPITNSQVSEQKYKEIEPLIELCNVFSRMNNQSIYVIDYSKKSFLHVVDHHLFLCGYSVNEVKEMGYAFYEKVVSADDLKMILEINKMGWELFYKVSPQERAHYHISYDFFLNHKNGDKILVNHKLSPLCLTDDNNIWLGLCIVNYSPYKESGNVVFSQHNKKSYYSYNFKTKKLITLLPYKLTKREIDVLRLTMQGYNESDISDILDISVNTVKNHRRNAEKKLNVTNLANAVSKFNLIY